ncbi:MAG: thermonuclease family protein, partial [Pseudanabaenaceae cyanobacterium]
ETQEGQLARQALQRMLEGQPLQYRARAKDRYGRLLAEIRVGQLNVNRQLVLEGHATYYNPYTTGCEEVAAAARQPRPAPETIAPSPQGGKS